MGSQYHAPCQEPWTRRIAGALDILISILVGTVTETVSETLDRDLRYKQEL